MFSLCFSLLQALGLLVSLFVCVREWGQEEEPPFGGDRLIYRS